MKAVGFGAIIFGTFLLVILWGLSKTPEQQAAEQVAQAERATRYVEQHAQQQAESDARNVEIHACVDAEYAVRDRLKAPSTAKFPTGLFSGGCSAYRIVVDQNEVWVHGYVDAQNSFGAMIRSPFTVVFDRVAGAPRGLVLRVASIDGDRAIPPPPPRPVGYGLKSKAPVRTTADLSNAPALTPEQLKAGGAIKAWDDQAKALSSKSAATADAPVGPRELVVTPEQKRELWAEAGGRAAYEKKVLERIACSVARTDVLEKLQSPNTFVFPEQHCDRVAIDGKKVQVHGYVDTRVGTLGPELRKRFTVVYDRVPSAPDGLSLRGVSIQ